ncbi:pyridoxal 5'-phosphate synthase [Streptomyces albus subsp. chlorinus]|uniref:phenazine biosynthesis FMN-dependent oxidase PhzG n=1 Tax=Streptomyces albus TaxID=1888 RepID=UPI0015703CB2|nr:phenazine biosynthesis FMN-dependent oxidase PhzG [Streptomyces albus]NSC25486.1 pyridoxal 5'-phosphate synthase [Streptomyces albus subsp. chlorinus]
MSSQYETLTGPADPDFPEYDNPPPEPLKLAAQWLASAIDTGVREPKALALATADRRGRPSSRTVVVLEIDQHGLRFSTHSTSRKGREIAENGWASGLLYWRETAQQLIFSGPVVRLDAAEADRHWEARPAPLRPMSTVSWQSDRLDDPEAMLKEAERLTPLQETLARPDRFATYRLEPTSVEFWASSSSRLHRRLRYDLTEDGWRTVRLQP